MVEVSGRGDRVPERLIRRGAVDRPDDGSARAAEDDDLTRSSSRDRCARSARDEVRNAVAVEIAGRGARGTKIVRARVTVHVEELVAARARDEVHTAAVGGP